MFLYHWTKLATNMIMKKVIPPSKPCAFYIYYSCMYHHVVEIFNVCLYVQTLMSTSLKKILCILGRAQPPTPFTNNINPDKI